MSDTFDEPYDVGGLTLNFRAECVQREVMDHDGSLLDLEGFKEALVSSMKKPIVVSSLEEYERLDREGKLTQPILTQVLVHVSLDGDEPVRASLRTSKLDPELEIVTYVCKRDRDAVRLVGEPDLGPGHQRRLFISLAEDVAAARIFDDESPVVASALRGMLDRR